MPLKDLIQNQLTPENLEQVNAGLTAIEAIIKNKTVNLTPEERQKYGSINEQNKLLVNKVNDFHISQPQFDTTKVEWAEFENDFAIRSALEKIILRLQSISEQLDDTKVLHDNDNYQQSLSQYAYISFLAEQNEPGVTTLKEEIAKFFPRSGAKGDAAAGN